MNTFYLGIDPGESGSAILLDNDGRPVDGVRFNNTEADISEWFTETLSSCSMVATIEQVHAMPKQGVSSSFKFGKLYGFIIGLLTAHKVPYKFVTPQRWQKGMQCMTKGDKNISKAAAQRLWPNFQITHAVADALLIAEYGRLTLWKK